MNLMKYTYKIANFCHVVGCGDVVQIHVATVSHVAEVGHVGFGHVIHVL
jgi:hypothetical protein